MLVESGLPPAAAIRCATLNNAKAVGQDDRLGTIEPGKVADLILLDAESAGTDLPYRERSSM